MPPVQPDEYCLLWINWWATCLTKGEWASWGQAIGTIAAVGVAVMLSQLEYRRAREEEDRRSTAARLQTLETVGRLLFSIHWSFVALTKGELGRFEDPILQSFLRTQLENLDKVDPLVLHTPELAQYIYSIRVFSRRFVDLIERGRGDIGVAQWLNEVRGELGRAMGPTKDAIHTIRAALRRSNHQLPQWVFEAGLTKVDTDEIDERQPFHVANL